MEPKFVTRLVWRHDFVKEPMNLKLELMWKLNQKTLQWQLMEWMEGFWMALKKPHIGTAWIQRVC